MKYQDQTRPLKFKRNVLLTLMGLTWLSFLTHCAKPNNTQLSQSKAAIAAAPTPNKVGQPATTTPTTPALAPDNQVGTYSFTEAQLWGNTAKHVLFRVVGAAEGTVSVDGVPTQNYFGHTDPGNDVWNRGAYSYQFGNAENLTPEQANERQANKIKRYNDGLVAQFKNELTELEYLHALDLINQAPLCVGYESNTGLKLSDGNYFERLKEAKAKGLTGEAAIIEARVNSFINPSTGRFETTFVSEYWLRVDQTRRTKMIGQALAQWKKNQDVQPTSMVINVSFAAAPYKNMLGVKANDKIRGARLSENGIKAQLWYQGNLDKSLGIQPQFNVPAYQEGYVLTMPAK